MRRVLDFMYSGYNANILNLMLMVFVISCGIFLERTTELDIVVWSLIGIQVACVYIVFTRKRYWQKQLDKVTNSIKKIKLILDFELALDEIEKDMKNGNITPEEANDRLKRLHEHALKEGLVKTKPSRP